MGVAAEVFHDGVGATKRRFGVDDPVLPVAPPSPGYDLLSLGRCARWRLQFTGLPGGHKLPEENGAKDLTHRFYGKEKTGLAARLLGTDPLLISVEATTGHNTMHVWMEREVLAPGVQYQAGTGARA